MNWNQLLSTKRFGLEAYHENREDDRTEFQRDYDRLIFSAPFRRLQNKTQVFPLPGSVFVHNRLTHSLEVACVGRSLGASVGQMLDKKYKGEVPFINELGSIVSAACLAHDMGNPPFGHSGEKAIASYFSEGKGQLLEEKLKPEEWKDFTRFEGNANAFRLLTHQFNGRRPGGFVLTYSTLASIVKYPYASIHADEKKQKFGFFASEKASFERIATELGISRQPDNPHRYMRHPLVYLVEAADDICYQIMDIEDAHKLRILTTDETKELFLSFFDEERRRRRIKTMNMVTDTNEQIAYLRSSLIGLLIHECTEVFVENEEHILNGTFNSPLIKQMSPLSAQAYRQCSDLAVRKIYNSTEVLDVELGGYKIILTLLEHFVTAVLEQEKAYSRQLLMRIPQQFEISGESAYCKIMSVLDYISGMTDVYALDLYRKITGMSMPSL
ncbi:deoxyguanosinetriphosphate triphosphohydrolase [Paludibacter sp. 221]|uniref:deoxyguanosinetriphosphate triphosphohydrolase n=1 Tax=Paludibacter sp. 221 TaxID=2302939 RepID=UPI0013D258FB|nr:deoxyguanosinetriphosphate triphosphohydrolase [Paludibacter sp. 221]NDV46410.1 deoxyguanosinetriphosphate triphosphohydrolase [Paludibacter sp. 221]